MVKRPEPHVDVMTGLVMQLLVEAIHSQHTSTAFNLEDLILRLRDKVPTYKVMKTISYNDSESAFKRKITNLQR